MDSNEMSQFQVPGAPNSGATSHGLLVGRTVVVTASADTGIGFATARRCAEEGSRIVISDRHERRLAEAAESLTEVAGGPPLAIACDVTDPVQVENLFARVIEEYGSFDVVINNAGLGGTANVLDMTDEQWHSVLGVTLTGTFLCMRAALRHLVEQRSGETSTTLRSSVGELRLAKPTTRQRRPGSWP